MEDNNKMTTFVHCTDGSKKAFIAFMVKKIFLKKTALNEFMDKNNKLIVLHIFDSKKTYLPPEYLPEGITQHHRPYLLSSVKPNKN